VDLAATQPDVVARLRREFETFAAQRGQIRELGRAEFEAGREACAQLLRP
jgi:hypothetical protein